jgi:thioredoxin reductase (NADPH)
MTEWLPYVVYLLPLLLVMAWYLRGHQRQSAVAETALAESVAAGLTEPPSLHPIIDAARCIGSGACARVCPEQALGIVNGKAVLINPASCIGHGACETACPMSAIQLVFGTERRGIELPRVKPNFETNVDQLFVAGELGGMGLIRKAAEQGSQAIASIAAAPRNAKAPLDVIIVGAGPAGLAASLGAKSVGLRYVTLEQETSLGGAILHYPRNKVAMTAPMRLPIIGKVKFREVSKEVLLEFWEKAVDEHNLYIRYGHKMEKVTFADGLYTVTTPNGVFQATAVLLAIGRRGTPRKLGVPGEEMSKVVYRLLEPEQYRDQRVLVVGGGDSAIEAAVALAHIAGTRVALSYRGDAFSRIKAKNRKYLESASEGDKLTIRLRSEVTSISHDEVELKENGNQTSLGNDAVLVFAGGEMPNKLMADIGIEVDTHRGERVGQLIEV